MDLGLDGATAVVQGGTQGMGRAAAESLAKEGARVAVLARTRRHAGDQRGLRSSCSPRARRKPSEIGPLIAFLCSQANTYMTGANINVDGGSDFT
jgi:NAD(P)-dependent dehydrogenase (short-subunit alcohol dehydrogenase family)